MIDVLTFGECMLALRSPGHLQIGGTVRTSIAGAEANVAVGLARLGHSAAWVGRVGDDTAGSLVRRALCAEGIQVHAVVDEAASGIAVFDARPPLPTRVDYHRAGSAGSRVAPDDVLSLIEEGLRVLHVTGVTTALSGSAAETVFRAVAAARAVGARVSLDVNYRSRLWPRDQAASVLRRLVPQVDVVIASEDELDLVADDVSALHDQGVTEVVVKHGARGSEVHLDGERPQTVSAPAVQVAAVDPVGAGDAFTAGYLSGWLDGLDTAHRLARGNAMGAFAVSSVGDWEGLPTRAELALLGSPDGTVLR
jgi:sugar/nucleoside kinase (ribokinase family)